MDIVIALIAFLFGLCLIISLHELGHFMFAKKYNVLCYDYSIGMGPLIYGKKKGETLYGIRAIPLGGFVAMADGAVANDLLEKDSEIGIKVNENNIITDIILTDQMPSDIRGKVVDRDVYCMEGNAPYIILNIDGTETNYEVDIKANVYLKKDKPMQLAPYDRCFESKTKWQRFVMLFAGPGMNFILAIFLFIIAGLLVGKPSTKPIIGSMEETYKLDKVEYKYPAFEAGLKKGDQITKINDKEVSKWNDISIITDEIKSTNTLTVEVTYVRDGIEATTTLRPMIVLGNIGVMGNLEEFSDADGATIFIYTTKAQKAGLENKDVITKIEYIDKKDSTKDASWEIHSWSDLIGALTDESINGKELKVTVNRAGEVKTLDVPTFSSSEVKKIKDLTLYGATIGVSPKYHFDFLYSFVYTFKSFGKSISSVWGTLGLLFTSKNVGVKDLSGPVGIFSLIKNSLAGGFANYIYFLGFLSVNIGIVNLLPIPALDGGRIVFVGIEAVTRKKVNKKVEDWLNNIVFFLLIGLFIYITINDVLRL
ncbi:MAG: RIP metalloprotease RseP, partial [bacterium]|nr:RIP metalloprotease RseP [bacterium]